MKLFVEYKDDDTSCADPECCGGSSPNPCVRVFLSIAAAKTAGARADALVLIETDSKDWVSLL